MQICYVGDFFMHPRRNTEGENLTRDQQCRNSIQKFRVVTAYSKYVYTTFLFQILIC